MAKIVLVGFMGAGKTTIGRLLAQRTGYAFIDLDEKIVQDNQQSIPDIFKSLGEAGFRELETQALKEALQQDVILATGGGTVTQSQNRQLLVNDATPVVFLTAAATILNERVKHDFNRPLAQKLDLAGFSALEAQREAFYRSVSDFTLPTAETTPEEVVQLILEELADDLSA